MLGFGPTGGSPIGGILVLDVRFTSGRDFESRGQTDLSEDVNFRGIGTIIYDKPLDYRIFILDSSGTKIGELDKYRKVTFGKRLNNYGQAEFDISVTDDKSDFIDLRKNTIEIYRQLSTDSDLVWAGEQAVRRSNLNARGNNWSEITCYTWFEQLFQRYTDEYERYETEDAADVIEALIATTQGLTGGDIGITSGTIDTTYTTDIIYQNDNIGDAILGLSDGGLDFEITDAKVLNVKSIIGSDKTDDVIIEYGHNVTNMTITEDFSNPVNQAIVLGEVIGEDNLQRVERTDATARTAYGLRQTRMNQLEPAILSIFQDKGDGALRKYKAPLIKVDFDIVKNYTPSIDQFTIGDGIRLIVNNGVYSIDEEYRVFEWQVTFDSKNNEKLTLILGKFII